MYEQNFGHGHFPSFEEGWLRRSNERNATASNRRGRGGQTLLQQRSDLPAAPYSR